MKRYTPNLELPVHLRIQMIPIESKSQEKPHFQISKRHPQYSHLHLVQGIIHRVYASSLYFILDNYNAVIKPNIWWPSQKSPYINPPPHLAIRPCINFNSSKWQIKKNTTWNTSIILMECLGKACHWTWGSSVRPPHTSVNVISGITSRTLDIMNAISHSTLLSLQWFCAVCEFLLVTY